MATGDLITQKQAAQILNRSISAVSRAIRDGRLEYIDSELRLLHRPGLEMRFRRKTRPRIDKPQRKTQERPGPKGGFGPGQPELIATTYWERLNQKLEFSLGAGPVYWQQPSDPQRLWLFCKTIDELRQQCEMEGLEP